MNGVDDIIIGAPYADPIGEDGYLKYIAGESYVVFGGNWDAVDAADGMADGQIELFSLNAIQAEATLMMEVTDVNDTPIAEDIDGVELSADGSSVLIDVLAASSDTDGDELSISQFDATGGEAEIVDNQIQFTPDDDPDTTPSLLYTVSDGTLEDQGQVSFEEKQLEEEPLEGDDSGSDAFEMLWWIAFVALIGVGFAGV